MTAVFAPVCLTVLGGCPMRLGPVMLRAERVLPSPHGNNRDDRACASAVAPVHSSLVFMNRILEARGHVLEVPGVLCLLPVLWPSVSNAPSCGLMLQRIQGVKTTPTPDLPLHVDV